VKNVLTNDKNVIILCPVQVVKLLISKIGLSDKLKQLSMKMNRLLLFGLILAALVI